MMTHTLCSLRSGTQARLHATRTIVCQSRRGLRLQLETLCRCAQIPFDHQEISFTRSTNDAEQATHLDDFFELLVDEPLEKALRQVVVLLHRMVHQPGDLPGDFVLP